MAQFHPKARECSEGVDDEATAVTGVVVTRLGIRRLLNRTVDANRVADPLLFPPRVGGSSLRAGGGFAKGTPG